MRQSELRVATSNMGLALFAVVLLFAAAPAGHAAEMASYVPSEYIIHVTSDDFAAVEASVARMGCTIVKSLPVDNRTYLVRMDSAANVKKLCGSYCVSVSAKPLAWVVDRVQPNFIKRTMAIPDDALWSKMWDMVQIRMPSAWDIEKGNSSVIVSVNDTGVAPHPDLAGRLLPGCDCVDNDYDASPEPGAEGESHGTHCAGTIAAQGGNQIGICGVCWNGVKILPVRVLTDDGGTTAQIIEGLNYSLASGADVVSMSYGGYWLDSAEHEMIKQLANAGIILVASAGNDHTSIPSYPAGHAEVVSVAATDSYEALAPYSNYGKIEIAAPGGNVNYGEDGCVWSTFVSWDSNNIPIYDYKGYGWEGTSMACPHVAGAAALLLSHGVPAGEVVERLLLSARAPVSGGMDKLYYGAGILDVQSALSYTTLRIAEPCKGANVTSIPHFRINTRGIDPASIKIYLDYADVNDDGVPDSLAEAQIVNYDNVYNYWDPVDETIEFDWLDAGLNLPQASGPLTSGAHSIYIIGSGTTGGASVSDWATFYVSNRTLKKGIHMVAFPYVLSDRILSTPSSILQGANFASTARPRSTLIRWIAAPKSASNSTPIGYQTYVLNTYGDHTWATPSYTYGGQSVLLGGGLYRNLFTGGTTAASPAGSGFWLILPEDVYVDETLSTLDSEFNFDGSKGFEMSLYYGWNMIGNPYAHDVPWRAALFTYKGQTKSLLDAESAGWVRSTLYGYGGSSIGYVRISNRDTLQPFAGYWILAQVGGISQSESLTVTILP